MRQNIYRLPSYCASKAVRGGAMDFLFGFSGRIGRLQWWLAQLAMMVAMIAGIALLLFLAPPPPGVKTAEDYLQDAPWAAFFVVIALCIVVSWIGIASIVKRYHDRDKSGWWYLIVLVPLIGPLWQLIECGFLPGSDGGNSYGQRGGGERYLGEFGDEEPTRASRAMAADSGPAARRGSVPATPAAKGRPSGFGRRGI